MYNANWNAGIIHTVKHGHLMYIRYGERQHRVGAWLRAAGRRRRRSRDGAAEPVRYVILRGETAMDVKPSETGLDTYEVRYRAATHGMRGSDRGTAAPQELRRGGGARTVYYV